MTELALDDDQRHAFTGQLDRVGVPQLMRSEAPANAGSSCDPSKLGSRPAGGPRASTRASVNDAEQRTDRERDAAQRATAQAPATPSRPSRPRDVALPCRDGRAANRGDDRGPPRAARALRRCAGQRATTPRPVREAPTVQTATGDPHDRDDLLDSRRVCRIPQALVARRPTGMKAGHRRRRPATTGGIKNERSGHELHTRLRTGAQPESTLHRTTGHLCQPATAARATQRKRRAPQPDIVATAQSHG